MTDNIKTRLRRRTKKVDYSKEIIIKDDVPLKK